MQLSLCTGVLFRISAGQCATMVTSAAVLSPSATPGPGELAGSYWKVHRVSAGVFPAPLCHAHVRDVL
jgi:hypothetical protein